MSFRFTKQTKLVKTDEFSSVFNLRRRVSSAYLLIWVKPNALGRSRLGLVVAKKVAKLAVDRNYMKRVVREIFRIKQHDLPGLDLIIQVQKKFDRADYQQVKQEMEMLLKKLLTQQEGRSL